MSRSVIITKSCQRFHYNPLCAQSEPQMPEDTVGWRLHADCRSTSLSHIDSAAQGSPLPPRCSQRTQYGSRSVLRARRISCSKLCFNDMLSSYRPGKKLEQGKTFLEDKSGMFRTSNKNSGAGSESLNFFLHTSKVALCRTFQSRSQRSNGSHREIFFKLLLFFQIFCKVFQVRIFKSKC